MSRPSLYHYPRNYTAGVSPDNRHRSLDLTAMPKRATCPACGEEMRLMSCKRRGGYRLCEPGSYLSHAPLCIALERRIIALRYGRPGVNRPEYGYRRVVPL